MSELQVGDEVVWPMGLGFKMHAKILSLDPETQTGEMQVIKVTSPPRPRYVRGHEAVSSDFGQTCANCGGELILVHWAKPRASFRGSSYYRHKSRPREPQSDRDRRFCSKCGKHGEWYEFKPGSGECTVCQT